MSDRTRTAETQTKKPIKEGDGDVVFSLRRTIVSTLLPLLDGATSVALVDFPTHANVGDSMIWLGQYEFMRTHGIQISYVATPSAFSEIGLRRCSKPSDPILIQGGGNLGDLWPTEQALREKVISKLHDRRIIQLPQSIWFKHADNLRRASEVFRAHPDFTLIVRDAQSRQIAHKKLGVESYLCPDMAFCLNRLKRSMPKFNGAVWLGRNDQEQLEPSEETINDPWIEKVDWVVQTENLLSNLLRRIQMWDNGIQTNGRIMTLRKLLYRQLASQQVARGVGIVSRGRSLITERLHGHILALLLGIPHVVVDNSYGKTRAFYETWTKGSHLAHWSPSRRQASKDVLRLIS